MIPLLETMGFLLSTNTESLSLSNFCAALLARMLLDALSTSCRARSIVPEGLRWSSQELIKKKGTCHECRWTKERFLSCLPWLRKPHADKKGHRGTLWKWGVFCYTFACLCENTVYRIRRVLATLSLLTWWIHLQLQFSIFTRSNQFILLQLLQKRTWTFWNFTVDVYLALNVIIIA